MRCMVGYERLHCASIHIFTTGWPLTAVEAYVRVAVPVVSPPGTVLSALQPDSLDCPRTVTSSPGDCP